MLKGFLLHWQVSVTVSKALNVTKFCEVMIKNHSGNFTGFAKTLAKTALSLPIRSVSCDREFSAQNRIKSCLTDGNLQSCMRISVEARCA